MPIFAASAASGRSDDCGLVALGRSFARRAVCPRFRAACVALGQRPRQPTAWLLAAALTLVVLPLGGCLSFHPDRLPGTPTDATFVRVGDVDVHYVATPAAEGQPTVVLLHGFGASTNEWRDVRPGLEAAGIGVVALDLKGHGWTTRPEGDYSIRAHAALALGAIDALPIRDFVLIGHSWGSAVALAVALEAPDRVRALVLYNGMFFQDQQPTIFHWSRLGGMGELMFGVFYTERLGEKLEQSVYDPDLATEAAVDRVEELWTRPGARAAALATVRAMDFEALEPRWGDVKQPVMLLWGREDRITPLHYGERLYKALPNARLEVIPQCGHAPMLEATRITLARILGFLREVLQ